LGDVLAHIGGADLAILRQTPHLRSRFVQMAWVLIGTAGVAALSMYYALSSTIFTGAKAIPTLALVALGLGWGFVIFNLDRYLTTSMSSVWGGWKLASMVVARLLLATVLGIVVATPLVLQVFAKDIDRVLADRHRAEAAAVQTEAEEAFARRRDVAEDKVDAAALEYDRVLTEAQTILDADPVMAAATSAVTKAADELAAAEQAANKAHDVYNCDYYGTPSREELAELYGDYGECSGKPGPNDPAPRLKERSDEAAAKVEEARALLTEAETAAETARSELIERAGEAGDHQAARLEAASDALAAAKAALGEVLAGADEAMAAADRSLQEDNGLQAQLVALTTGSDAMRVAHLIVAAVFMLVELLPVLVKSLACLGPANAYDLLVEHSDEVIRAQIAAPAGGPAGRGPQGTGELGPSGGVNLTQGPSPQGRPGGSEDDIEALHRQEGQLVDDAAQAARNAMVATIAEALDGIGRGLERWDEEGEAKRQWAPDTQR
jgi:hypothetical protein